MLDSYSRLGSVYVISRCGSRSALLVGRAAYTWTKGTHDQEIFEPSEAKVGSAGVLHHTLLSVSQPVSVT